MNAGRGVLVAFEGGEGSGKSTQVTLLAGWLRDRGHDVVTTYEPGDGALGTAIRSVVLDPVNTEITPRAEALLYAADRAQHVATIIAPALDEGRIVITDRYTDSSLAYQGAGRGQPLSDIAWISQWATGGRVPDLTVLLDLPVTDGLARVRSRPGNRLEQPDRLEAEPAGFHERVRRAFAGLAAADPARYLVLDATATAQALAAQISAAVEGLLVARQARTPAQP